MAAHVATAAVSETADAVCDKYKRIFSLRNDPANGLRGLLELMGSTPSVLLRHEVAYALGQMGDEAAVPHLRAWLEDAAEDPIVRHEAAEALGAIGTRGCLETVRRFVGDPASEVAQTCELALARLEYNIQKGRCVCERAPAQLERLEAAAAAAARSAAAAAKAAKAARSRTARRPRRRPRPPTPTPTSCKSPWWTALGMRL